VSAQLKEVVVDADSLDAKDLRQIPVKTPRRGCWELQRFLPVPGVLAGVQASRRSTTIGCQRQGIDQQESDGTM